MTAWTMARASTAEASADFAAAPLENPAMLTPWPDGVQPPVHAERDRDRSSQSTGDHHWADLGAARFVGRSLRSRNWDAGHEISSASEVFGTAHQLGTEVPALNSDLRFSGIEAETRRPQAGACGLDFNLQSCP